VVDDSYGGFDAPNPNHVVVPVRLVDPITLQGVTVPARSWIVQDWIPNFQVTMLGGDGGVGKSPVAQQLMTACATGGKWLGLDVKRCKAIAIFCEDDADEIHRRQVRINEAMGLEFGDLENMAWASTAGEDNILAAFDRETWALRETEVLRSIIKTAMDFGAELIILDSLYDLFSGNENDRGQAQQFIGFLRQIAIAIEGAVLLTAHPSVRGIDSGAGTSGNTAWHNAVRSRLYLHRPKERDDETPDDNARILSRRKANYAGTGDGIDLEWKDGVFALPYQATGAVKGMEKRNAEMAFMDALKAINKRGQRVNASLNTGSYAPRFMARSSMSQTAGFTERDLVQAMNRLFDQGRIVVREEGPKSRRRGFIDEGNGELL